MNYSFSYDKRIFNLFKFKILRFECKEMKKFVFLMKNNIYKIKLNVVIK